MAKRQNIGQQFLKFITGGTIGNIPEAVKTAVALSPISKVPEVLQQATPLGELPEAIQTALPIVSKATPIGNIPEVLKMTPLEDFAQVQQRSEAARATALEGLLKGESPIQSVGKEALPILKGENKRQFGDILREKGVPEPLAATGGLIADIATDPLTYVLGGVAKATERQANVSKFLNPTTIEKSIKTKPHSIISASLANLTPEENLARTAQLADDLTKAGHTPIPVKGNYGGVAEDSFLVPNLSRDEALTLAKKYGQESIVTEKGAHFTSGGFAPKVGETQVGEFADNFSEVNINGKIIKFQHPIDFNNVVANPPDILSDIIQTGKDVVKSVQTQEPQGLAKEIVDAFKGKGAYADLPQEVIQTLRQTRGEQEYALARGTSFGNLLANELKKTPQLTATADLALKGDVAALNQLPETTKNIVSYMRKTIDRYSNDLTNELEQIAGTMTEEQLDRLASVFGVQEGRRLPLPNLIQVIKNNQGQYVKRMYQMFIDNSYKPSQDTIDKAVQGLIRDFDVSESRATGLVKSLVENKSIDIPFGRASLKIKQGSFIARQNIPEYLREVMGEIKDPRYNYVQTVRNLAESSRNLELFRSLKEQGFLSDIPTGGLTRQLPNEGALAWGLANGQYTSPEIADLLTHTSKIANQADSTLLKIMTSLKFAKTVLNPKTHGHNMLGNMFFGFLDDNLTPIGKNQKYFTEAFDILKKGTKSPKYKELVEQTVIKNELPTSDEIKWLQELIQNPYSDKTSFLSSKAKGFHDQLINLGQKSMNLYSWEDQIFKTAAYLRNKAQGLSPAEATAKVFESWPNYAEATKLAQTARSTGLGQLVANPFMTFRTEAHRIMINSIKDPTKRLKMGILLGATGTANAAILAASGNSLSQIWELMQTRPETVSETLLNPASKDFDLNTRYINPFNPRGIFAPVLALTGASGVNPLDYILDFTQFSPDFGYSNLITGSVEGVLTGKGQFGQELSAGERIESLVQGLAPTSISRDLPKIISPDEEPKERIRRGLRFLGIDVEQRNPNYIRNKVRQRLQEKVVSGEPVDDTLNALETLGFDSQRILSNVNKSLNKKQDQLKKERIKGVQNAYPKNKA